MAKAITEREEFARRVPCECGAGIGQLCYSASSSLRSRISHAGRYVRAINEAIVGPGNGDPVHDKDNKSCQCGRLGEDGGDSDDPGDGGESGE